MGRVYLFRGISASGKTAITDKLSREMKINIIRKDDIFDEIHAHISDHKLINSITYDVVAKLIQTQIDNHNDCLVDVGLPDKGNYENFISKIHFNNCELVSFLCICSDKQEWIRRIEERMQNPLPHQSYKGHKDLLRHYERCDLSPVENEFILDSVENLNILYEKITSYVI